MEDEIEMDVEGADEAGVALPNSVVKASYKLRYVNRANAMARKPKGVPLKALRRCNGDWLAIELAKLVLDEKAKLVIARYTEILDANGIAHAQYKREGKGWQGRLRMSTRLALERTVAEDGELVLPDGATISAPRNWVAAHTR